MLPTTTHHNDHSDASSNSYSGIRDLVLGRAREHWKGGLVVAMTLGLAMLFTEHGFIVEEQHIK